MIPATNPYPATTSTAATYGSTPASTASTSSSSSTSKQVVVSTLTPKQKEALDRVAEQYRRSRSPEPMLPPREVFGRRPSSVLSSHRDRDYYPGTTSSTSSPSYRNPAQEKTHEAISPRTNPDLEKSVLQDTAIVYWSKEEKWDVVYSIMMNRFKGKNTPLETQLNDWIQLCEINYQREGFTFEFFAGVMEKIWKSFDQQKQMEMQKRAEPVIRKRMDYWKSLEPQSTSTATTATSVATHSVSKDKVLS